jgi:asparagine synthase (glutamine-hydrolysing)
MFTFAFGAGLHGRRFDRQRLKELMAGFPARAPDGTEIVESSVAAAGVSRWEVVRRDVNAAPSWDPATGILFAGDVRLYNRSELVAELGLEPDRADRSDLDLARRAYLKWGHESPRYLVGDFAFSAWDERSRSVFAARDHLGIRPLFYCLHDDVIGVGSDVRQLLGLFPRPSDEINTARLFDWFSGRLPDSRQTFFHKIYRLRPGHCLIVSEGKTDERRYWWPPVVSEPVSYADNCAWLRELFNNAVQDRIESDRPIIAHSSGGFDSSAIIMAADQTYRAEAGRPPLTMVSAVAPGFPSDETHYIDAVARSVLFKGIRWNVVGDVPRTFPGVLRSAPVLRRGIGNGPCRDIEVAQELGARVLLSGVGGDEILYAGSIFRDFVRHGRVASVFWNATRSGITSGAIREIVDSIFGLFPPATAVRLERWIDRESPVPPPEWMGPMRTLRGSGYEEADEIPDIEWQSHVQIALWMRLNGFRTSGLTDAMVEHGTHDGIEVRLPFLDVRLVEQILKVPWVQRDPQRRLRRIGWDALGSLLPAELSSRGGQPSWAAVRSAAARAMVPCVASFIRRGPWLSAPFIDRGMARGMLEVALTGGVREPDTSCSLVCDFGALEAWLRSLS